MSCLKYPRDVIKLVFYSEKQVLEIALKLSLH